MDVYLPSRRFLILLNKGSWAAKFSRFAIYQPPMWLSPGAPLRQRSDVDSVGPEIRCVSLERFKIDRNHLTEMISRAG